MWSTFFLRLVTLGGITLFCLMLFGPCCSMVLVVPAFIWICLSFVHSHGFYTALARIQTNHRAQMEEQWTKKLRREDPFYLNDDDNI